MASADIFYDFDLLACCPLVPPLPVDTPDVHLDVVPGVWVVSTDGGDLAELVVMDVLDYLSAGRQLVVGEDDESEPLSVGRTIPSILKALLDKVLTTHTNVDIVSFSDTTGYVGIH